jgi:hypothetical protein
MSSSWPGLRLRSSCAGRASSSSARDDGSRAIVYTACIAPDAEPTGPRKEIREQRWTRCDEALRLLPRGARRRPADALSA